MESIEENDIVIQPRKGKNEKAIPENGLLLVNPTEAHPRIDKKISAGAESRFLFNSKLCVADGSAYFMAGPAIGSPMAAMSLEKLIVLGAKRIILCGWCGAIDSSLKVGDIIIPDSGLIGEGTSAYYNDSARSYPSSVFSSQLVDLLTAGEHAVSRGCVWSTDGVYRENRKYLKELSAKERVVAVDMEYSALCSVAGFRGIDFSAVLIVSDEIWGESWRPGFSSKHFHKVKDAVLLMLQKNVSNF